MRTRPCKGTYRAYTHKADTGQQQGSRGGGRRKPRTHPSTLRRLQLLKVDSKDASRRRRRRARSIFSTIRSLALAACLSYLRLREAEGGRQLRPLREGQVLRPLEPALQLLDLQRRVDGPRLPHLLAFAVDPCQFAILYRLFNVICNDRWARERAVWNIHALRWAKSDQVERCGSGNKI